MVAILRQVLAPGDRDQLIHDMSRAPMLDGRQSAGQLGQNLKQNAQVDARWEHYGAMVGKVLKALGNHRQFNQHAIPRRTLPPLFSRYSVGSEYQSHVDNAFMGPFPTMRTDLSITIFLNDPGDYMGGELSLETPFGTQE